MPLLIPVVLACLLLILTPPDKPQETDTNFDNLPPIAAAIAQADKVVLYEGLPHQLWEKELLAQELKNKQAVQFHGFPFYAEPLDLKPDDARKLIALSANPDSFRKWAGYKRCGGFHPDYLIEYHVGKDVYRVLVCFGCGEAKVFGPKSQLYCELNGDGWANILKQYQKNRPQRG